MTAYTLNVTVAAPLPIVKKTVKFQTSIGKIAWLTLSWWRGLGRGPLRNEWH
jgi:hypothetical protein